jgi:hypothetical protein
MRMLTQQMQQGQHTQQLLQQQQATPIQQQHATELGTGLEWGAGGEGAAVSMMMAEQVPNSNQHIPANVLQQFEQWEKQGEQRTSPTDGSHPGSSTRQQPHDDDVLITGEILVEPPDEDLEGDTSQPPPSHDEIFTTPSCKRHKKAELSDRTTASNPKP